MQNIGVVTVLLLLAAFALERVGAAAGFLIPEPETDKRKRLRKVAIFAIIGAVACAIVQLSNDVRILRYLQPKPDARTDVLLTWLVLVAGSDQVNVVAGWLSSVAAGKQPPVSPIRVEVNKA
jgi:hypothetical protein